MHRRANRIDLQRRAFVGLSVTAVTAGLLNTLAPSITEASTNSIYTGLNDNIAVSGYDTVAYFTQGEPVLGDKAFSTEYNGAEWHFSSQANLDLFNTDPEKYAPQFGGHCAYGMALGSRAQGDPKKWTIVEGKLYLNYTQTTRMRWISRQAEYIPRGDSNWARLSTN